MKKLILSFKAIGAYKATNLIERATELTNLKSDNLLLYGEGYLKTSEYAKIELAKSITLFKYAVIIALFRIK